ncbi:hypothetical protein Pmani_015757 [Petrolisthes manimaculis]|uniref:Uncharacterized protein n=1 Tax=Petrolisthes manimaculis TaxID=1843537 RepID=A0AAE1PT75_9EUCA|nr:hypothetical protein Pmani_015757 [Petrolisthes manimaculis]
MLERPSIAGGVLTTTCPDSHQCLADPSQLEVQQRHPSPQLNDTSHPTPSPYTPSPHSLISTCSDNPHLNPTILPTLTQHPTPSLTLTATVLSHPHTPSPLTHLFQHPLTVAHWYLFVFVLLFTHFPQPRPHHMQLTIT